MNVIENRMVRIDRLILPGDFPERLESQDVADLAESIEQTGLINVPIVRESDLKVLAGRDRVAAKRKLGEKICEVRIVECNDLEAELIELDENLKRRHNTQEQIDIMRVRRIEIAKRILAADQEQGIQDAGTPPDPPADTAAKSKGRGRPRNEAVREAANRAGVSTSTMYRTQRRTQGREKSRNAEPPAIKTHGLQIPEEMNAAIADLVRLFAESDRYIRQAQSAMTRIQSNKLPIDTSIVSRIKEQLAAVAERIRTAAPSEACPYCWHHPAILNDCPACGGSGFIRVDQADNVPPELQVYADGEKMVSFNGKFVKYTDVPTE